MVVDYATKSLTFMIILSNPLHYSQTKTFENMDQTTAYSDGNTATLETMILTTHGEAQLGSTYKTNCVAAVFEIPYVNSKFKILKHTRIQWHATEW